MHNKIEYSNETIYDMVCIMAKTTDWSSRKVRMHRHAYHLSLKYMDEAVIQALRTRRDRGMRFLGCSIEVYHKEVLIWERIYDLVDGEYGFIEESK